VDGSIESEAQTSASLLVTDVVLVDVGSQLPSWHYWHSITYVRVVGNLFAGSLGALVCSDDFVRS
jgi:hypothetical protein